MRRGLLAGLEGAAEIAFDDGRDAVPLKLRAVLPDVDPRGDSVELRLTFTGPRAAPGTPGRLVWRDAGLALPPYLIVQRDGVSGVFSVNDEVRVHVTPSDELEEGVEVSSDPVVIVPE